MALFMKFLQNQMEAVIKYLSNTGVVTDNSKHCAKKITLYFNMFLICIDLIHDINKK